MTARILLALLLTAILARAQIRINSTGPSFPTIQSAIDAAMSGDTITVGPGTYVENLTITNKQLAIIGAGSLASTIDASLVGRALEIDQSVTGTTTIQGFWITQGRTPTNPNSILDHCGGAVLATTQSGGAPWTLRLEDCTLIASRADLGGGLYSGPQVHLEFIDSRVLGCGQAATSLAPHGSAGGGLYCVEGPFIEDSDIVSNFCDGPINLVALGPGGLGGGLHLGGGSGTTTIDATRIVNNKAHEGGGIGGMLLFDVEIRDSLIQDNRCDVGGSGAAIELSALVGPGLSTKLSLINCLFVGNRGLTPGASVIHSSGVSLDLLHCTLAGNGGAGLGFAAIVISPEAGGLAMDFNARNSIVGGNTASGIFIDVANPALASHCLFGDGWTATGLPPLALHEVGLLTGLLPGFVDPGGDYRLLPGSPGVDEGIGLMGDPTTDLSGDNRVVGAAPDMGCFELQNLDPGPAFAGTTSTPDVLSFNGTSGGGTRSVTVDAGSIATIAVAAPTPGAPAPFILWGYLGVPGPAEAFSVPFAGGVMAFTPHLVGIGNPLLFTFSNNILSPNSGLLLSTPAPWQATGPCVPFPLTMTLQGLIVDGPGALRLTNAMTLHAR